ncbi:EamA family transporter [Puniceicoccales bacterium CK1056]|uniref:EamA family transporter n=1 Tax=Oceanipulchritudo coccoides TaxID=2706888 RepID=A0A6B2M4K4_9BACT|nr:EamA family transporter [Oceanipulchritudo coccoides]NDV63286.1 EamA family transporter [Oceanipulchritudo coccoides]
MWYLLAVSILWGFSFGLVKSEFSDLSGATLACTRLLIALPCFIPFLKRPYLRWTQPNIRLIFTGAVQYGLMYVALFNAFTWLTGYEVALLTIFTPLYVVLAHAVVKRQLPPGWFWWTSILAVMGALWIFQPQAIPAKWPGILLMQLANLCFASGQIAWRQIRAKQPTARDTDGYALLYLGGVLAALPFALLQNPVHELAQLSGSQWGALLYLGAIASGLGFFLWNAGAARVNPATLAVFNNLKIPVAILISINLFREQANLASLLPGLAILLIALGWAEWASRRQATKSS